VLESDGKQRAEPEDTVNKTMAANKSNGSGKQESVRLTEHKVLIVYNADFFFLNLSLPVT